jgi:hypothetical protein
MFIGFFSGTVIFSLFFWSGAASLREWCSLKNRKLRRFEMPCTNQAKLQRHNSQKRRAQIHIFTAHGTAKYAL